MKQLILVMLLFAVCPLMAQEIKTEIPPNEIQIKTAVLPAPEEKKDGAMVYGYNSSGELVVLRKGTNNLVCIGDNPSKDGINVACYSKRLEPFMARGRELSAKDLSGEEREKIRAKEVASGKIKMPKEPSMMYVYYGKSEDYDVTTGELQNGKFRYVIYTPFATTESTGLPDKPHAPGMPWLMDPGTHRAHIMVGPFN
ncbi:MULTISPECIES: hypothetical protein [Arenibacter]|jgi:hypothetical protein|uniref:Uncharacterized protein n=1 Tax=Arenibacter algicola TaxID=616991 RepID=A0A221URL4_9FLAO|nr:MULTISPECIES: hypothetical protein [Arenibacter]ASO03571.1 hypothetical protein AREALGSMS7_00073 [Arenibacter algicola]GBF18672.1 hypothetical protein C21_00837 [Arenibacter sp. NBRC 103722]